MQEFILHLELKFSDEEKQKCLPTALRMVNLAYMAESHGILALKNEVTAEDTPFMKMGVDLILEGLTPDVIEKILQLSILSDEYAKTDLLDRLLILQGLTAIAGGYRPFVTAHIIGAVLGEKYISKITAPMNETLNLNDYIDKYTFPLPESSKFEKRLLELTRAELSLVLMPMDYFLLTIAFIGCSKSFINKMRDGVSENTFKQICKTFSCRPSPKEEHPGCISPKEEISEHQNLILRHLENLEKSGVIIKTTERANEVGTE